MRAADIRHAGAMRPADPAAAGSDASHDAGGFQQTVSGDGRRPLRPQLARMDGVVPAPGGANQNSGTVSGGGQHASGAGRADGGAVGPLGGGQPDRGPGFDGRSAKRLCVVVCRCAERRRPERHHHHRLHRQRVLAVLRVCAAQRHRPIRSIIAPSMLPIYRKSGNRWAMTERPRRAVSRTCRYLHRRPKPSVVGWHLADDPHRRDRGADTPAHPRHRARGSHRDHAAGVYAEQNGNHCWWPIAPCARVQVALDHPHLRWQGDGYFDMNSGDAPLERGFTDWQWARGATRDGAAILYEAQRRDGSQHRSGDDVRSARPDAGIRATAEVALKRTGWRVGAAFAAKVRPALSEHWRTRRSTRVRS